MDFSETIAARDQKVSWSRHLIEYMKVRQYMVKTLQKPSSPESEVKFGNLGFCLGKSKNSVFFQKLLHPVTRKLVGADI